MSRFAKIIFVFVFISHAPLYLSAADQSFGSIKVADEYVQDNIKLHLNGTSYRKVGFFKVKVWLSALYVEVKSTDALQIIDSDQTKVVILYPLYNVSAKDSVKGWRASLDLACDEDCKKLSTDREAFLASVPEFKVNDKYVYVFNKNGMSYSVNGKEVFKSHQRNLGKLILSTWIGLRQADQEINRNLLGQK